MARRERTVASWEALSSGNRRRWNAHGGREAYLSGASLTKAQRGHAFTPSSPLEALRKPWEFPRYVGTHTSELNDLARERGLRQHGTGERGDAATDLNRAGGAFTWVLPDGTLNLTDWRFSQVFRSEDEAQLYARQSWAPAGVVMIVDRGPDKTWRYEVWFGYPESRGKSYRGRGGKMHKPDVVRDENIALIRQAYEQRAGETT